MDKNLRLTLPRLSDDGFPEFSRQVDILLGKTEPYGAVTLFDARDLGESEEALTLIHEQTHQTLFRLTALGHLTNCLWQFAQASHYKDEYKLFVREQLTIQELTAYYVSLSWSARRSKQEYENAWSKTLPKYQSLLEPVFDILPLTGVSGNERLLARGLIVEAVARSAFNSECLQTFSSPESLSVDSVEKYLHSQSTHERFVSIFNSLLTSPGLEELERQLLEAIATVEDKEPAHEGLKWKGGRVELKH